MNFGDIALYLFFELAGLSAICIVGCLVFSAIYSIYEKISKSSNENSDSSWAECIMYVLFCGLPFGIYSTIVYQKHFGYEYEKVTALRDSLKQQTIIVDSLGKVNASLNKQVKEEEYKRVLSDEEYKEFFGEEKRKPNKIPIGVYICTGETSTKYHLDPDCRGLSRCSGEIEEVSEEEAEDMGRTPCKICY